MLERPKIVFVVGVCACSVALSFEAVWSIPTACLLWSIIAFQLLELLLGQRGPSKVIQNGLMVLLWASIAMAPMLAVFVSTSWL